MSRKQRHGYNRAGTEVQENTPEELNENETTDVASEEPIQEGAVYTPEDAQNGFEGQEGTEPLVEEETQSESDSEPSDEEFESTADNIMTDDIPVPEVNETIYSDPHVNLEEEAEEQRRLASVGELTQDEVLAKVGLTARLSLHAVIDYIDLMHKVKMNFRVLSTDKNYIENKGPEMQVKLYRNIMDIITKTDDVDFRYSMDFLMQLFVKEKGGALSFMNLSRYQENLNMDLVNLRCYPNLMRMLTLLADPIGRHKKLSTEISFEKTLEYGFTDAARARLIKYFSSY